MGFRQAIKEVAALAGEEVDVQVLSRDDGAAPLCELSGVLRVVDKRGKRLSRGGPGRLPAPSATPTSPSGRTDSSKRVESDRAERSSWLQTMRFLIGTGRHGCGAAPCAPRGQSTSEGLLDPVYVRHGLSIRPLCFALRGGKIGACPMAFPEG
jgi:hypothetical protein